MKLRTKISLLVAVSFVLIGSAASFVLGLLVASRLEKELAHRGVIAARHATSTIAAFLVDNNLLAVRSQLDEFLRDDPDARYLYVIGFDGEVAAHTFDRGFPSDLLNANIVPAGNSRSVLRLTLGREHVSDIGFKLFPNSPAEVHYGLSEGPIEATVLQLRGSIFLFTTLGTLVSVAVVSLITTLFIRPLDNLARRVSEFGVTGSFQPREMDPADEVGQLNTTFNLMASRLRASMDHVSNSEQRYRTLVELAQEGVVQVDVGGAIVFANRSFLDMLGYPPGEGLLGCPFEDLLQERSRLGYPGAGGTREVTPRIRHEEEFRRRDGSTVHAIVSGTQLRDEKGEYLGFFAVITDITGRRMAEEQIRKANEDLERQNLELSALDRMKDGLIRDVSHELKTPVAKQAMQIEMLKDRLSGGGSPAELAEMLQVMEKCVRRQEEVIRNILNLGRLEAGGRTYRREPVRLDALLGGVLDDYLDTLKGELLSLEVSVQPVTIRSDEEMLRHVFSNLVNNAIKFRKRDGTLVLKVSAGMDNGEARVVITDNGVGLGGEEARRAFERFYQASPSDEGSGVGLSIARKIVEDLGGRISLESPGRNLGASAVVILPLDTAG